MNLHRGCMLLAFGVVVSAAATGARAHPDSTAVVHYINQTWATLTRSADECRALVDPKAPSHSVVYLPWHAAVPAQLAASASRCHVRIAHLPRRIDRLGQILPRSLPAQGLLYLPHPYIVPGGRFNAMYGWDSYFIELGLLADHRESLARDMVDNMLYEVANYGGVLNANRTYYLSRSQPPFLSAMIAALLADPASFPDAAARRKWLAGAYPLAVRYYAIWTRAPHLAGNTGLARYFDFAHGPVIESSGSNYYVNVIRWLLAHPAQDPGYLIKGPEHPDAAEATALAKTSCDVTRSQTCARAWVDGYRLTAGFYAGDRAMRESGFDTNFHFGPWGGSTEDYAGTALNSLLYRYARDLHDFAVALGKTADAQHWLAAADARRTAMDKYLWHPQQGRYMDYDFVTGKASTDPYLSMFYPMWAGAADPTQAKALVAQLKLFDHRGGLAMSTRVTGAQWDAPYGWAPTNWLVVRGLQDDGFGRRAVRVACQFTGTIDRSFAQSGTIVEKYNVVQGNADTDVTAGYRQNQIGFGWTNGVYLEMRQLIDAAGGCGAGGDATPTHTGPRLSHGAGAQ